MGHPLDGAWLKVGRAREHLSVLDAEMCTFTNSYQYDIAPEKDAESGDIVMRFHLRPDRRPKPGARLGLLVGDAVHNLRSALNHLAWQLAIAGDGPGRLTQFPIFDDPDKLRAQEPRVLKGIVERHRAQLRELQPYHVREAANTGHALSIHDPLVINMSLLAIGRLDNMDKHRVLLPITVASPWKSPKFEGLLRAKGKYPGELISVEDGAEFYRITEFEIAPGATTVQVKHQPTYSIFFGDPTYGPHGAPDDLWSSEDKGLVTRADLVYAADSVDRILTMFAAELGPAPPAAWATP